MRFCSSPGDGTAADAHAVVVGVTVVGGLPAVGVAAGDFQLGQVRVQICQVQAARKAATPICTRYTLFASFRQHPNSRERLRITLRQPTISVSPHQRDRDVEHSAGGLGKGELASRAAIDAGSAGVRVHDGGLARVEEPLDTDLAAL